MGQVHHQLHPDNAVCQLCGTLWACVWYLLARCLVITWQARTSINCLTFAWPLLTINQLNFAAVQFRGFSPFLSDDRGFSFYNPICLICDREIREIKAVAKFSWFYNTVSDTLSCLRSDCQAFGKQVWSRCQAIVRHHQPNGIRLTELLVCSNPL